MVWLCLLAILLLFFGRAYRNTFQAVINHVPLAITASERIQIKSFLPFRVLHLSDLHVEKLSIEAKQVIAEMRHEPLDLIAITGDLLDRQENIPRAVAYVEKIMDLRPLYGTFVVFGNHDYLLPPQKLSQLKRELERIGCVVLCNESVTLQVNGQKLHVIGVDDYATRRSNLAKAFRNVSKDGLRLVLTHDPNLVLKMEEYEYDYLLSGHFHGGQIHWPKPFHLAKMGKLPRMNMVQGLHYHHGRPFYISEGLGQTGLNVRVRSRPEITLHTLHSGLAAVPHAGEAVGEERIVQEAAPTLALE